ncbi:MAG: 50S ribosomal protein L5 [Patescibacteria group bacterium]
MALAKIWQTKILPELAKELKISNSLAVPKFKRVIVNARIKSTQSDDKYIKSVAKNLERITGQKAVPAKAKKSISSFKIRAGMVVGLKVTLRGKRMYDFLERLVNITLPRVRDFQGLPMKGFAGSGSYTVGFREHLVFPEIPSDEIELVHGLQVTIVTSARNEKEGAILLRKIGFPLVESLEKE